MALAAERAERGQGGAPRRVMRCGGSAYGVGASDALLQHRGISAGACIGEEAKAEQFLMDTSMANSVICGALRLARNGGIGPSSSEAFKNCSCALQFAGVEFAPDIVLCMYK